MIDWLLSHVSQMSYDNWLRERSFAEPPPSEWSLDNLPPYVVLTGKKLLMLDPPRRAEAERAVFVELIKQLPPVLPGEDSYGHPSQ